MHRKIMAFIAVCTLALTAAAKEKKPKSPLPFTVLSAKTVAIIVDPNAGRSLEDPMANQIAQRDVEAAMLKWGRFAPQLSTQNADLIIVIRKGTGRIADATISDPRGNNRPGSVTTSDDTVSMGGQRGTPSNSSDGPPRQEMPRSAPQLEMTDPEDTFAVYDGRNGSPLNAPPIWRYTGRDGLRARNVPAVDEFRKAVADTEKAAAAASKNP